MLAASGKELKEHHATLAAEANAAYVASRSPTESAKAWEGHIKVARGYIGDALRASKNLTDIAAALMEGGVHMLVYRYLMAPPISQDQFKLACSEWNKGSEGAGRVVKASDAGVIAAAFAARRMKPITCWLNKGRPATFGELRRLYWYLSPLIASQQMQTEMRNGAATVQEGNVIAILKRKGWTRLPSKMIDTRAALPEKHYMHKTRFATKTAAPQEVDIALGLKNTVVMAMECKVSNDVTNSVKRVNDVLKKAAAWDAHWGSFVRTAALLQGVVAPKDVGRLIDGGVEVFWSHDLTAFEAWIDSQV